ncbi:MAG TPA: tetratricopeptide repeat protein, partial [Candidatus Obscuribacterales bacterium]
MPVPPQEVPDGLSPEAYKRLANLYTLMGCQRQAAEAMSKSIEANIGNSGASSDGKSGDGYELGMRAGMQFGLSLLKLLRQTTKEMDCEDDDHPEAPKDKPMTTEQAAALQEMRSQLLALGISEEETTKYLEGLVKSLEELKTSQPPPRDVPEGLSAKDYYELGLKYKEVGWTEQARDALQLAMEADPDGESGKHAQRFLRTKIPRFPVPLVAEQTNIRGFNQLFHGEQVAARETFEALIEQYPDFEWPYGNLGSLCIQLGEIRKAKEILKKALEINPYYVNAWLHMARAEALDSDFEAAYRCLDKVIGIDPDDQSVKGIKQLIDQVAQE